MGLEWPQLRAQYAHVVTQAIARGLRQADLAARAGVHQSQISKAKHGKTKQGPTLMTFIKVVEATGVSLTEFFNALEGQRPSAGTMTVAETVVHDDATAHHDRAIARAVRQLLRLALPGPPPRPRAANRR